MARKSNSKLLLNKLFSELQERNISHVYLSNRDTGEFWERLGFTQCAIEDVIRVLPNAPQVTGYLKDGSIWTDVAWSRML